MFQSVLDLVGGSLSILDEPFGVSYLSSDLGLALFQGGHWKSVGQVGLDQFLFLSVQLGQAAFLVDDQPCAGFSRAF
ncbi:hypothetical protein M6D93_18520 [Jatrophihabitans telluris]|uniref:Uncharacterized protein n=1 Tax=Jatrophihabitans telluris TaxID=2038343 RepID=A0ABY4QXZ6_9ACTN|nr:hypothetical protein [Jatrophihabitans telluris]UQX88259.1 hypothetical protein M6D93_18520 [Jatrophihabitans telluris]